MKLKSRSRIIDGNFARRQALSLSRQEINFYVAICRQFAIQRLMRPMQTRGRGKIVKRTRDRPRFRCERKWRPDPTPFTQLRRIFRRVETRSAFHLFRHPTSRRIFRFFDKILIPAQEGSDTSPIETGGMGFRPRGIDTSNSRDFAGGPPPPAAGGGRRRPAWPGRTWSGGSRARPATRPSGRACGA